MTRVQFLRRVKRVAHFVDDSADKWERPAQRFVVIRSPLLNDAPQRAQHSRRRKR